VNESIAAEEYEMSACEGFKGDFKVAWELKNGDIVSVIINCTSA
jgi:hypothetical protein